VRSVSSRVDPQTRSATVRAKIPNPDRLLKPGMLMKVDLLGNPREALAIPEGALQPDGRSNFVMVVENTDAGAVAKRREVRSGTRRQGEVEILEGLSPGEKIVAHGAFKLSDGASVRVIESGENPAKPD
jgi:membrane fusion protein (multidrug efflux system)